MADPTAIINHTYSVTQGKKVVTGIIKSAEALVPGGHVALNLSTGHYEFAGDAANLMPCGLVDRALDGNNAHLTGNGTYKGVFSGGNTPRVSVTGASAVTDTGKFVYATDGQTYTLTRPADDAVPCGIVISWDSSTYCYVYMFNFIEAVIFSMLKTKETLLLGSIPTNALQGTAAAEIITDLPMHGHFTIDDWYAVPVAHDNAAVAGSQVLELDIGATSVKTTGGVNDSTLTLAYTSFDEVGDMGTAVAGSAIAADNEVHDGDTLSVRMNASGTGFTADSVAAFNLYLTISRLPGA